MLGIHFKDYLAPIDVMIPINENMTVGQMIVVSRILDIESIRSGQDPFWANRLGECFYGKKLPQQKKKESNLYFKSLVACMDQIGWDYGISGMTVDTEPLTLFNNTHKLAYALLQNPCQVIPCNYRMDGWPWCKDDGVKFWLDKGLSDQEIKTLRDRYFKLFENIDTSKYIIIEKEEKNRTRLMQELKSRKFDILQTAELTINPQDLIKLGFKKKYYRLLQRGLLIRVKYKDYLTVNIRKKRICSVKIDSLMRDTHIKNYLYTPTITEKNRWKILLGHYLPS